MIKAFIFDLDGVITDTAEYHFLSWKRLTDEIGWRFDREINEQLRGVSRLDSIQIIADHNQLNLTSDELNKLANEKNQYYVDSLDQISTDDYLPGVRTLLDDLKSEGVKIGLGSASKNSRKVLEQLEALSYFDVIGDGNSVAKSKPAPDIFLHVAKQLEVEPSESIVVEDAESGVEAAKTGGFHCIGIGPHDRVGKADLVFASTAQATLAKIKSDLSQLF